MLRASVYGLLVLGWLAWPAPVRAHHFTIDLTAQAGDASKTARAETAAPGIKPKARVLLRVKAKGLVTVRWTLTNSDAKATFKNVTVHFVAVRQEKLGQATMPKLNRGVVAETALTMDFKPRDSTKGELAFTMDAPGPYLLRLETIGAAVGPDGHEHFAALDLLVE
jgi:hypothetical protein